MPIGLIARTAIVTRSPSSIRSAIGQDLACAGVIWFGEKMEILV